MNLTKIIEPIESEVKEFKRRFAESLKSNIALIDIITKYILRQKGKKIRPILVLLSAKLCGEINDRTYIAATLVELLHTATLIHDDVVDEARTRRGLASINAVWKNKVAVLIGDFLLSKGLLISLQNNEYDFLQSTSEAVKRMSEGELLQIQKARNFEASEKTYFKIIGDKTASFIKACCKLGAQSVTTDKKKIDKLSEFGENLGIVFQITDDLLDYTGRKSVLGKSIGNDVKEKKFTLPLIYSLEHSPQKEARAIIKAIKKSSNGVFDEVYDFVYKYGGIQYARDKASTFAIKATSSLADFPDSVAKNSLLNLVEFVRIRNY
ncbi:MAG: polyprenyl synthetase family protein [Ignavibacteria bacterium]